MSRPLSYASLESVLKHIDANSRFQISQRLPSLRALESRVPLKVHHLRLQDSEFTIDDTTYSLVIRTKYPDTLGLEDSLKVTDDDEFGFAVAPYEATTGDLYFQCNAPRHREHSEDDLKHSLAVFEEQWKNVKEQEWKGFEWHENVIRRLKSQLLPYQLRRDNTPLAHFLELTVTSGDTVKVYRKKYTMKIGQAMKELLHVMLARQESPIQVSELCFPGLNDRRKGNRITRDMYIRLPKDVKFATRSIQMEDNTDKIFTDIRPFITESSFPLKKVSSGQYTAHPDVKNARELVITSRNYLHTLLDNPSTQYFLTLKTQKMHMMKQDSHFKVGDCIPIIKDWLDNGKEIGTCFKFGMQRFDKRNMVSLKRRFNMEEVAERSYTIPMNSTSKLMISFENTSREITWDSASTFTMEVVDIDA